MDKTKTLLEAAQTGDAGTLRGLLDEGISPRCINNEKQTPLHLAAMWGNPECVSQLLAANIDPDAIDKDGNTPIHLAATAQAMSAEPLRVLLEDGRIDKDAKNYAGQTAVQIAAGEDMSASVRALLKRGAILPDDWPDWKHRSRAIAERVERSRRHVSGALSR